MHCITKYITFTPLKRNTMKKMFKQLIIAFVIFVLAVGFSTIEEYRVIAFIVAVIAWLYIILITDKIDNLTP